ncbi:MAG: Gamma-glutamyl-L-1-hydroxyisopropylamide hydrolase [Alphaproteobacteria bacterium MarineAlpha5_Bin8]|nr:MAG: Gamma-glutamyl-L-1-hydroxyisopropylamide hydrolase [Alphaproteobacteria bacterium MarineAlpha5_Bin7]PPR45137.1 MAG: Gamma-glutamyl-L-1-hydroxyisopropylamide hydrolase [Alphaproteobacteria bacterium MarineAlpha5_Bin8]|tara:strand:+ start:1535 stop:2356 length:822 start_codon:yes stop_codon:yes gene_type:complete
MNILIVDGNEEEASQRYTNLGMETQYQVYEKVINKLSNNKFNISTIHPAFKENYLPQGTSLEDFDGIVWTGSLLNIYDYTPSIINQIELAKELFTKKNKIFGSCWGLHILVTAAGGKIRKNPKGLEAVIAKDIQINDIGMSHKMYKDKKKSFNAFCWHFDETETLPDNSIVLSSNLMSKVQSISFERDLSSIWAVQYHPEFDPKWIAGLMNQREEILLKEKSYSSLKDLQNQKKYFYNYEKLKNKEYAQSFGDLIDEKKHTLELFNWIESLNN